MQTMHAQAAYLIDDVMPISSDYYFASVGFLPIAAWLFGHPVCWAYRKVFANW